jgi:hypothetical protein
MRAPSLDNPRARMRRAHEHLDVLQKKIIAFTDREPYAVVRQPKTQSGVEVFAFEMREQPPLELGVIVGDFFHNLRSALENLAWQIVLLDGGTPDEHTGFPVASDLQGFKSQAGSKLKGVDPARVAEIESVQPYPARNDAISRALETVHDFARIDRHQIIHPAFAVANTDPNALTIRREPITAEFNVQVEYLIAGKPLEDGAPFVRLRTTTRKPQTGVKMEVEFPIRMAFGERGLSAIALPAIWWQTNLIVETFTTHF